MNQYIDLHVHSNISDGTLSPAEVVIRAADHGLSAIALTDHDTVNGIPEAKKTAEQLEKEGRHIRVIEGVEISAAYKGRDIHILGFFLNINNQELKRALDAAVQSRDERNEKMAAKLREAGFDITVKALEFNNPNTVITRAHFARYMAEHKYVRDRKEAFDKYLGNDCPCYVEREYMKPEQAIRIIKNAGGIPILAHPLLYKLTLDEIDELIRYLKDLGIVGIETIYSANTGFDEGIVRRYVNKYDLLMTGGSDFHGANKPQIEIGSGRGNLKIPYSLLEKLEEYKQNQIL